VLSFRASIPLLATVILLAAPAEATTSYYQGSSGETAFTTAVGGLTLLDPSLTFSASDLAAGGLFNASGTGIDFLGFDDLNNPGFDFTVNTNQLTATQQDQRVRIDFPVATPIYAFGFHITYVAGTATYGSWCVGSTQGSCSYSVINSSPTNVQFFGIVSDAPITAPLYIQGANGAPKVVFTNFEAFADPVPEANTMLLVGLGLVILPLARRKTRPER
jgi:PEP-CTERM motif